MRKLVAEALDFVPMCLPNGVACELIRSRLGRVLERNDDIRNETVAAYRDALRSGICRESFVEFQLHAFPTRDQIRETLRLNQRFDSELHVRSGDAYVFSSSGNVDGPVDVRRFRNMPNANGCNRVAATSEHISLWPDLWKVACEFLALHGKSRKPLTSSMDQFFAKRREDQQYQQLSGIRVDAGTFPHPVMAIGMPNTSRIVGFGETEEGAYIASLNYFASSYKTGNPVHRAQTRDLLFTTAGLVQLPRLRSEVRQFSHLAEESVRQGSMEALHRRLRSPRSTSS